MTETKIIGYGRTRTEQDLMDLYLLDFLSREGFEKKWNEIHLNRVEYQMYRRGLEWILHEHHGGGWPPRDLAKVSGWTVVRLLAHMTGKPVREVAGDLIKESITEEHQQ